MKIPVEIVAILNKIGRQDLSFSEKRKLLHWYQQLNTNSDSQLTKGEEAITEEKIFSHIQNEIERKFHSKK